MQKIQFSLDILNRFFMNQMLLNHGNVLSYTHRVFEFPQTVVEDMNHKSNGIHDDEDVDKRKVS